jgi:hypothetical protein
MFAAKYPSSRLTLLGDLCALCVKKTRHPHSDSRNSGRDSARPSNSHRMTFLAHPHHLTPTESYSSQNRGRGAAFSEVSKCATRTNTRNLNQIIGLLHNFWIPPGGGHLGGTGIPACLLPSRQLRPPVQSHWTLHGVNHRRTRPPRLKQVRLQPEIPFRRPVRIVNQHQPGIVLQSLSLQYHRLLILPQKFLRENPKNPNWQKQIPCRHKINPAQIAPHGRYGGPARKPQLPAANFLRPDIRQHKINRRRHRLARIFFQHPVRRAVRARRMWAHAKATRNRFKLFFFLVNAVPAAPVPRLMDKRPVRRIHQSNNSLVHMRRQLAS